MPVDGPHPATWGARAAGIGLLAGLAPWLLGLAGALALGIPDPPGWLIVVAVPAAVVGGWVGYRLADAERALLAVQIAAGRRERELLSRAWFARSVMDNVSDAVLIVGSDGRVVDANPVATELFRIPTEGIGGAPLSELLPDLEDTNSEMVGSPGERGIRTTAARSDGTQIEVDVNVALLAAGPAPDLPWGRARLLTVREIQTRPVGAQILKEAAELQRGRWIAEQRRRGQVLEMLGNGIRGHVERLFARTDDPEELEDVGHGLLGLLEQLWTLAMWERSGADPTIGPVDITEVLETAIVEVTPVALRRANRIVLAVDDDLGEVISDAVLLRCALRTLLLLVLRPLRESTVRVEAVVEAGRGTDWVTVILEDDRGRPLTTEQLEAVQAAFDASEEVSPPSDDRAAIALARRLARALGGHVTIGSHPSMGTSISLRVPRDPSKVRWVPRATPRSDRIAPQGVPARS